MEGDESPKTPLEKAVYWAAIILVAALLWLYVRAK